MKDGRQTKIGVSGSRSGVHSVTATDHAKNATTTYILLSPWHSVPFLFSSIKKKLAKSGFSYVQYDFSPNILTPDVDSTEQYFDRIRKEIGDDIRNFTEKYKGTRKDEIGQLGETLIHISNELEGTIEMLQVELNKYTPLLFGWGCIKPD